MPRPENGAIDVKPQPVSAHRPNVPPSLASCLAETLPCDTDGIHPDEVLGFALDP
jgi:hypothetical protein